MFDADIHTAMRDMLMAALLASAPVFVIALSVGLLIALFQALTQIQEMTLTFVPKIVAIFLCVLFAAPFMYGEVRALSTMAFDLIARGDL
jgi:flagellar biosynthesis protein FliQ